MREHPDRDRLTSEEATEGRQLPVKRLSSLSLGDAAASLVGAARVSEHPQARVRRQQPRIAFGVTPDDRAADDASAAGAVHPAPTANSPSAVNLFRLEGP